MSNINAISHGGGSWASKGPLFLVSEVARHAWLCITRPSASTSSLNFPTKTVHAILDVAVSSEQIWASDLLVRIVSDSMKLEWVILGDS